MHKKVLIVCSVISFIEWFNKKNIEYLHNSCKYEVHIACNFEYFEDTDKNKTIRYIEELNKKGIILHQIPFSRTPFSIQCLKSFIKLKNIINIHDFSLIHVHTPTASIITRLASINARKKGSVVMYTCHGFHFHKSAPAINWILYYPIEKIMSKYCDYIVTINKEDYSRTCKFYTPNVRYIPGVGVNVDKIQNCSVDKMNYKKGLGIPETSILILSIGEMIERKNHEIIIKALGELKNPNIYYAICGKGPLKNHLYKLAKKNNLEDRILFLGFRNDIPELCNTADISAFPSLIEGLGLAGIEAMSAGVPLISSNVHGILDYVIDGETGYACPPKDFHAFADAISKLVNNPLLREKMGEKCKIIARKFELNNALSEMWKIYDEILK